MYETRWSIVLIVIGIVLVVGTSFVGYRESAPELDDVHPDIPCDQKMIDDSDWLWVVPLYNDRVPEAVDPAWVENIKSKGKKIGMHGVRHTYSEFGVDVSREYIQRGIDAFTATYGFRPTDFKPPKMNVTPNNMRLLKELGLNVHTKWQQFIHKIYHCADHGRENARRLKYEVERRESEPVQPAG